MHRQSIELQRRENERMRDRRGKGDVGSAGGTPDMVSNGPPATLEASHPGLHEVDRHAGGLGISLYVSLCFFHKIKIFQKIVISKF